MATTRRERGRSGRPGPGTARRSQDPSPARQSRPTAGTARRQGSGGERPARKAGRRRRGGSGSTKTVPIVVGIVLSLVLSLVIGLMAKGRASGDVKGQMHAIVAEFADYHRDRAYYTGLVERAHVQVFDSNYQVRRRRNDFDPEAYYREMVTTMISLAEGDGRQEVALAIAAEHLE